MDRNSRTRSQLLRCCSTTLLAVVAVAQTQAPDDALRAIESSLRAQNDTDAIALADQALRQSPRDRRLWALKGIAEDRTGKPLDALAAFKKSLALSLDYLPALEGVAQVEYRLGDPHAAASLEKIVQIKPDDPTTNAMLAVVAYRHKDCPTAVQHFAKAEREIISQPSALTQYGSCLLKLKRSVQAISIFETMLNANPGDVHARQNLAVAQFAAEHYSDALATLQPLLDAARLDPNALDLASTISEAKGDTPRAVQLLRQAIVLQPRDPQYYLDFSSLCFNHSSFDIGIHMLDIGISQLPQDAALYLARGVLYVQEAKYDQAEADFEKAQTLDPSQSYRLRQGTRAVSTERSDGALATVHKQLKQHPSDGSLHFLLAEILMQKGAEPGTPEFKTAVSAAERALQLNPKDLQARDVLSNLALKSGDINTAIKQCRLALRLDPSDQTALYHLVIALRKSGRKDEIPDLLKRLADVRNATRKQEAAENRYKLYEPK